MLNANRKQHLLFCVLLTCSLIACSGCPDRAPEKRDGTSSGTQHDAFIIQPHGRGLLSVSFEGIKEGQGATLFRIEGNERAKVKELTSSDTNASIELESGFYLIQLDGTDCRFPVPALSPLLDSKLSSAKEADLKVKLAKYPKSDNKWSWIPAGPTVLGDTLGVGREDERPARIEDIEGFWLAQFETTNREYANFLNAYARKRNAVPHNWIDLESRKCRIKVSETGEYTTDAPKLPVVMVSLAGAREYCQWLTKETGTIHRLPNEAEWEKAARGPEMFVYSYGNIYKQASANQESGKLKPVGSYSPNSWGLHDMTGNAFEWMTNVADPQKKDTTLNHSLRGGSFVLDGMYLRNSFRMRQSPGVMTDDIGFRVVRESN